MFWIDAPITNGVREEDAESRGGREAVDWLWTPLKGLAAKSSYGLMVIMATIIDTTALDFMSPIY